MANWLTNLKNRFFGKKNGTTITKKARRSTLRLMVEGLENRLAPVATLNIAGGLITYAGTGVGNITPAGMTLTP